MNHYIQQPKTSQKQKKPSKVALAHPEIHPNKTLDELKSKEWTAAIQKEIDLFGQALQQVELLFQEASDSQKQLSLGSTKLVHDEFEFAASKLQVLRQMLAKYSEDHAKYHQIKKELQQTKDNITQNQKNLKFIINKEREKIQFQFGVAQRVLVLIQAYIKMKDQFENPEDLQKHRDYILQKIDRIKKTEEKHTKKIERHFNVIAIDDPNNLQEIEDEEEQITEESGYEGNNETLREHLIKLCDSLIAYFTKFEKKEGEQFLQHDLTTFQYFDQIKVAVPFYSTQIDQTIELIKEKRSFYENAPDTEFVQKGVVPKVVQKQQQKVDTNNEQEFPKLS
ncbi:unnamed protein product (macronuclear) [Paramecium tetraurelia]|uniref:Uncharacterized protein n=1 Tax=Paramecium tetraurelia TaxID=5888 RepID=A0CGC5_PARTE|nr:uncharacterized protein GSPATT00007282001 [Paramecium tetraurelia]CAK69842.1 unnamed protein product [Paramecium tetraurelia]|eukprot:XP_001437239.1 hypothetical protein (macronuclear) [Paramecium tetraurelia strain d4-2]